MFTIYPTGVPCQVDNIIFLYYFMREFFTIAIFKIKADIRMNKTTLNSQKEKHSLLSLRRATRYVVNQFPVTLISIHALLAESDRFLQRRPTGYAEFLSTLSLRRATQYWATRARAAQLFLSTLSLRRATLPGCPTNSSSYISIHALLAESDRRPHRQGAMRGAYFYPRSPCGERHKSA